MLLLPICFVTPEGWKATALLPKWPAHVLACQRGSFYGQVAIFGWKEVLLGGSCVPDLLLSITGSWADPAVCLSGALAVTFHWHLDIPCAVLLWQHIYVVYLLLDAIWCQSGTLQCQSGWSGD